MQNRKHLTFTNGVLLLILCIVFIYIGVAFIRQLNLVLGESDVLDEMVFSNTTGNDGIALEKDNDETISDDIRLSSFKKIGGIGDRNDLVYDPNTHVVYIISRNGHYVFPYYKTDTEVYIYNEDTNAIE